MQTINKSNDTCRLNRSSGQQWTIDLTWLNASATMTQRTGQRALAADRQCDSTTVGPSPCTPPPVGWCRQSWNPRTNRPAISSLVARVVLYPPLCRKLRGWAHGTATCAPHDRSTRVVSLVHHIAGDTKLLPNKHISVPVSSRDAPDTPQTVITNTWSLRICASFNVHVSKVYNCRAYCKYQCLV